jgi:hypothetical protein
MNSEVISYRQKDKRMVTKILYSSKHLDGLSTRVSLLSPSELSLFWICRMVWDKKTRFSEYRGWCARGNLRAVRREEEAIPANLLTQLWTISCEGITKGMYCLGFVHVV